MGKNTPNAQSETHAAHSTQMQGLKLISQLGLLVKYGDIPPSCVVNMDQTGMRLVPTGKHTRAPKGSKEVPLVGQDDKRMITVVLAISAAGVLLPLQVIFSGVQSAASRR